MAMMKTLVMLLMSAWWTGTADAFQIVATPQAARSAGRVILMATAKQQQQEKKSQLGFVSDWQQEQVDMERAKDCAEHFGSCPTEEVQGLRDSLHQERLQSFMFGGGSASNSNPAGDGFLQHRVLEEELDLQLSLLNANDSLRNSLFPPEQDMTMTTTTTASDDCEQQQQYSMGAKLIRDQMSLEATGLCLAILTLWFVPQLLSE